MNATIISIEPGKPAEPVEVDERLLNSLDWQKTKLGGGWPERVRLERTESPDRVLGLLVDEEGHLKGLPYNLHMIYPHGEPYPIAGPALVVAFERTSPEDETIRGLTNDERSRWGFTPTTPQGARALVYGGLR